MNSDLQGEALLKAWEGSRNGGITHEKHAEMLGIPYRVYKERYYEAMGKRRYARFVENTRGDLDRPELFAVHKFKPSHLKMDSFIAVSDIHVPCTDYDFAMLPAEMARKHLPQGKRYLIVHGDIFNSDIFSNWPKLVKAPSWAEEKDAASNLFAIWSKTFDMIFVMPGNHDYRILTKLEGELSFEGMMWDMVDEQEQDLKHMFSSLFSTGKLMTSAVDHCIVETPKGNYTVMHGTSYSVNALTAANEYAQKYQSHIISGHEHHVGITMDRFGRYFLVNNGGLFDPEKFAYVTLQANKRPRMKKGFTLVKDGYPHVFGPWTNWSEWI